MSLSDLTILRRSLRARLFSTITTIVTVGVAVALMLVLLSMRDSGRRSFERGSGNLHLVVSRDPSPLVVVLNGLFYARAPQRPIEWSKYEQIARAYPLDYAIPTQQGDSFFGFPVLATTPEFFTKFMPDPEFPWELAEGRFFGKPFEVVLGSRIAKETGLAIGDRIHLTHGTGASRQQSPPAAGDASPEAAEGVVAETGPHVHYEYDYTVVGILEPTGSAHDRSVFTDLDSAWIIHAHDRRKREDPSVQRTTSEDLVDADRLITGIYLRVATRPGREATAALQQVFDLLRRDTSVTVAAPGDEIRKLFEIVGNIDQILVAMAGVILVSSGISIMVALYNSIQQRRRQIAVLRVLGCSAPRVFRLVLAESVAIGLLGALAGLAVAFVGVRVVAEVMRHRIGIVIEPSLPAPIVLVVLAAAVVLAALAGAAPAVVAYRTPVAANLRPLV